MIVAHHVPTSPPGQTAPGAVRVSIQADTPGDPRRMATALARVLVAVADGKFQGGPPHPLVSTDGEAGGDD